MPHLQDLGTSGTLPPLPQNCYTPGFFCPKNCSDAGILGNRGTWVNGQTGLEFSGVVNGQTDGKRTNGLRNFLCNYQCHGQRNRGPVTCFTFISSSHSGGSLRAPTYNRCSCGTNSKNFLDDTKINLFLPRESTLAWQLLQFPRKYEK